MDNNEENISIVFGETGAGISSFINAITKSKSCRVSDSYESCTKVFSIVQTEHKKSEYYFIDTPGFSDYEGTHKEYFNLIKKHLSKYPKINCLILILNFYDLRLKRITIDIIKFFMQLFPIKRFFEHFLIVRTHADKGKADFKEQKNNIKDLIIKAINSTDLRNFMINKNIEIPPKVYEFFVDNRSKKELDNYEKNEEEYEMIFNRIKYSCSPMIN